MKNHIINQSSVLGLLTAFLYLLWFQYERGICSYYQIPEYFITPSISGLFICAIGFFTVIAASFKTISFLTPILQILQDESKKAWHGIIFVNIYYFILGIILSFAKGPTGKEILFFFIPIVSFDLIFFLGYWLFRKKDRSTEEM